MSKQNPEIAESGVDDSPVDGVDSSVDNVAGPDELVQRVEDAEKKALLAHAELDNFRRRKNRESAEQIKYASLPLMENLLEVVDNLSRALESAQAEQADASSLNQGVEMVCDQLLTVLENHGCTKIQALGQPFDPNSHEAIQMQPSDEPANTVIHEAQSGYKLHDRVVRPAKVIISTGPENQ